MVAAAFHPLGIFLFGLGGGFALPLLYRLGKGWLAGGFFLALGGIVLASGAGLLRLLAGEPAIEVLTAGAMPPVSINLRLGLWEAFFAVSVNVTALLGAWRLWERLRGSYGALLLYLILVMGIDGMIMTRDLFNLFVFLEIVSIATYGLLGLSRAPAALAAAFKYIMATVVASSLFLVGSVLLYHVTGTLNIDELVAGAGALNRPMGVAALLMLLAGLLIELKPFPANGWGLDVYETAPGGIAAMVSVGVSAGVFFALFKLAPLFGVQLGIIAFSGAATFLFSNLIGLSQTRTQRLLGYSSIGQMGLLTLALGALAQIDAADAAPLVIGGLFVNHLLAKAGLFWLADLTLYVISVCQGEEIPRKGGPGITRSDFLVINKSDLAPYVNVNLDVMRADAARMRGRRPFGFTDLSRGAGLDAVIAFITENGGLAAFSDPAVPQGA